MQLHTHHLQRLVNDLLALSRVQWCELHLQYSSFYLADVLAECVRQAQISAEEHTIYLDIASQDSKIVANKLRVGQIVGNILDNAIKFSPQGKQVTVKLQEQGNEYQVSVNDEGIGVSPEFSTTSLSVSTACAMRPAVNTQASEWGCTSQKL